jgi:hypothetical protein
VAFTRESFIASASSYVVPSAGPGFLFFGIVERLVLKSM